MTENLTIGRVSRLTGVPARTIRFYEDEGLVPRPRRTDSGYRIYTAGDVTRLRLIRGARVLGLDLPRIRSLLDRALGATCAEFGDELSEALAAQLADVERRIDELTALREELGRLQGHITHCCEGCLPDQLANECDFCDLLTPSKGGDTDARDAERR
jgi:DNA-binding transcriptional MerR regulator